MVGSTNEKAIAVLLKQKNELDAEFADVISAQKTPAKKPSRRGSALKKNTASAAKL